LKIDWKLEIGNYSLFSCPPEASGSLRRTCVFALGVSRSFPRRRREAWGEKLELEIGNWELGFSTLPMAGVFKALNIET
jgi:hypothetical protein